MSPPTTTAQPGSAPPEMRIKALAPWFGAKRNLAPVICSLMGGHRAYWEPFCGSMAVLLAKPPCAMETVNDLHGDLVNLARVIQDPVDGPRLYRMLRRTMVCDTVQREARVVMAEMEFTPGVLRAYWYFIESWLGRNGCAGTQSSNNGFCIRYSSGGGSASVRFRSAVASMGAWRKRLERVVITSTDSMDLIPRIADEDGTVMYCDPPYVAKGATYVHDFSAKAQGAGLFAGGADHADQHEELADKLGRFEKTRVIVSYYDHPQVERMYRLHKWHWVRIPVKRAMVNASNRGKAKESAATEVLICNFDPEVDVVEAVNTPHPPRPTKAATPSPSRGEGANQTARMDAGGEDES